jgi:hypothetical protein
MLRKGEVLLKCKRPGCTYEFITSGRFRPFSSFRCPQLGCGGKLEVFRSKNMAKYTQLKEKK